MAGWVRWSFSAARENEAVSATAMKAVSWLDSMDYRLLNSNKEYNI
jgi:hypothetical protein